MNDVLVRLTTGGEQALADLFSEYRSKLERMLAFRMDRRLHKRVDPADVLQEAYIEVARRVDNYISSPDVAFYVWVRQITWQTLVAVQRRHLGKKRDANLDVRLQQQPAANDTSFSIAFLCYWFV